MIFKEDHCYLVNQDDTTEIGIISLGKYLFKEMNTNLFPKVFADANKPPQVEDIFFDIAGIYVNERIYDYFRLKDEIPVKIENSFDVIFIFPEISRYNFQFSEIVNFRIFHYFGYFYQEYSSSENLPYFVNRITKHDNNSAVISYQDKTNSLGYYEDSLILTTYPRIMIKFNNPSIKPFQPSEKYIKISNERSDIELSIPVDQLPQDMTEKYITEIITKLVNLKYNSNFTSSQIMRAETSKDILEQWTIFKR